MELHRSWREGRSSFLLVAGFNVVSFKESDGSEGQFGGSFLGLSETFGEIGVSRSLPENGG